MRDAAATAAPQVHAEAGHAMRVMPCGSCHAGHAITAGNCHGELSGRNGVSISDDVAVPTCVDMTERESKGNGVARLGMAALATSRSLVSQEYADNSTSACTDPLESETIKLRLLRLLCVLHPGGSPLQLDSHRACAQAVRRPLGVVASACTDSRLQQVLGPHREHAMWP